MCKWHTALVIGIRREAIDPSLVTIYTETPSNYEIIGIVTASSSSGLTEQGDLDYAMTELKKQAAKIGANGVILEKVETLVIRPGETAKSVSGKAIYVPS